ncbi:uncharacterized protein [Anabrus simplex]|uniref:uncharacterized protein n=1 Tax=Anabrus simplex TaxID=316456 RepID=UPI0035A3A816
MLFKMDLEVKIKEEPICYEETSNTPCDNYKIMSEEMHLKEEPKSELAVPKETQPSSDIKNEISVDEHTVGQLVASFKEEDEPDYLQLDDHVLMYSICFPYSEFILTFENLILGSSG